ncbi:MAG: ribonuclease III [Candidatus Zixiibacteriota bacterium]
MSLWNKIRNIFTSFLARNQKNPLQKVQELIGYKFHDESLLRMSLTHRSYSHATNREMLSNERLEFLGDSVLDVIVAEQLYHDHPEMDEGELTETKALLVNESTLAEIGSEIQLNKYLLLAPEEERSGGRERASIISDSLESIIAAVFLDGGIESARDMVLRLIYSYKEDLITDASRRNFKGELLELVQARGEGFPRYEVVSETGPDHEKVFTVNVYVVGEKVGTGSGSTKKEAEQKAAALALERFHQHNQ